MADLTERERETAREILDFVRQKLLSAMPYISLALLKMPAEFDLVEKGYEEKAARALKSEGIGTDGEKIYTSPEYVMDMFSESRNSLCHVFLHMILHCIFLHPFRFEKSEKEKWDLSADIAIEDVILGLGFEFTSEPEDTQRGEIIRQLRYDIGDMTAERLYAEFCSNVELYDRINEYRSLFYRDNHRYFVTGTKKITDMTITDRGRDDDIDNRERDWAQLKDNARISVEVHAKRWGNDAGSLTKIIRGIYGEDRDYSEFLSKFAVLCEEVRINHEEFDNIYYTLGLERYGNMPLIEPLEYRESRKIRDLVIVIDTSGSCQGNAVRMFLARTYSILKDTRGFFDTVNVHLVQCDSRVQDVKIIHRAEELERYMTDIEIKGSGGTNFIPAFEYVDEAVKRGDFTDLRGILYFTDGIGSFPENKPKYLTAVILPEHRLEEPDIPSWALRLEMKESGELR